MTTNPSEVTGATAPASAGQGGGGDPASEELLPAPLSPWLVGWRSFLLRPDFGLPIILVALGVYLSLSSQYFFETRNLLNITEAVAPDGIAAAFATVVIISGGIDLTPTVVQIIAGFVCFRGLADGLPLAAVLLLAIVASAGIGLFNGLLIGVQGLNPFIVTLSSYFFFTGIAFVVTAGNSQVIDNNAFFDISQSHIAGIPTDSLIMFGAFALVILGLRYTRAGVHMYAIGGDQASARLSGVRVVRAKIWIYVGSAVFAGISGIVLASSTGAVAPYAASNGTDLLTILAAVIIGGTALSGGRGGAVGTLVGVLLLGVIANGLVLKNVSAFYQPVVTGGVLLFAIVADDIRRKLRAAL